MVILKNSVAVLVAAILLQFLMAISTHAKVSKEKVWVDTDASCSRAFAVDVDDCWALALLLSDPRFRIAGISTVFGNRDKVSKPEELRRILKNIGLGETVEKNVPVFQGAERPLAERGSNDNQAINALNAELEKGPIIVLALGPLTNIGAAISRRPDLSHRIIKVIAVAGHRRGERFFPGKSRLFHVHDMNFRKDVSAFEVVLNANVPVTLVPYAAGKQVIIGERELSQMERGNRQSKKLASLSRPWLSFWQRYFRSNGFFPFDLVAAAHLTNPDEIKCRQTMAQIFRRHGLFVQRDTLEVDHKHGYRITYCDKVDPQLPAKLFRKIDEN